MGLEDRGICLRGLEEKERRRSVFGDDKEKRRNWGHRGRRRWSLRAVDVVIADLLLCQKKRSWLVENPSTWAMRGEVNHIEKIRVRRWESNSH